MKQALLFLILLSCTVAPKVTFDNGVSFTVELARTPEEKAKGLMFQSSLPEDHGMLFVFEDEAPRSFWMKNTLIPLDMVFISADMKVVEIKANIPPCEKDPCSAYNSKPAKYVLEINAGLAEKKEISVDSIVSLRE